MNDILLLASLLNIEFFLSLHSIENRSEIIEKEPSIYDDYSIYDSHYG